MRSVDWRKWFFWQPQDEERRFQAFKARLLYEVRRDIELQTRVEKRVEGRVPDISEAVKLVLGEGIKTG